MCIFFFLSLHKTLFEFLWVRKPATGCFLGISTSTSEYTASILAVNFQITLQTYRNKLFCSVPIDN